MNQLYAPQWRTPNPENESFDLSLYVNHRQIRTAKVIGFCTIQHCPQNKYPYQAVTKGYDQPNQLTYILVHCRDYDRHHLYVVFENTTKYLLAIPIGKNICITNDRLLFMSTSGDFDTNEICAADMDFVHQAVRHWMAGL